MIGPFAIRGRRYRNQVRKSRRRFVPATPSGRRAAEGTTLMWMPEVTTFERIVRAAVGYGFLLIAFRVTGKRQVGQLTPFDLVVLLIISNVLQNAMIGPDNSIIRGLVGACTIFFLNGVVARATFHSRGLETLIDGTPTHLVHDGHVDESAMRNELVTRAELAALREAGLCNVAEARFVVLENIGRITAGPMNP
jgi:uncharacterized membrane protein YcaP (DUF421 family)